MLGKLFPVEHVKSIGDIDFDRLLKSGYRLFFFDYDFTLAPWGELRVNEDVLKVFEMLRREGAQVVIVTNAKRERVEHLKQKLPWLEIHWNVKKPSVEKIAAILREKGIDPKECVIIGDLFVTDVLAGNRLGMYTIMVNPVVWETIKVYKKVAAILSIIVYRTLFFLFGWIFRMGSLISPNEWRDSIKDVDYDYLLESGFKVFIFDFDNTLAPWRSTDIPKEHLDILEKLKEKAKVIIASNGRERRIDIDGVDFIWRSLKPLGGKIRKKLSQLGVKGKNVVVIGDQLFTDVLFGNLIGAYTIKVEPLRKEEALITKMNRLLERIFRKFMVKKPRIDQGERK